MSKTVMRIPDRDDSLAVAYVDDGQGRRLVLAADDRGGMLRTVLTFARSQREAFALIGAIRQLVEELPP